MLLGICKVIIVCLFVCLFCFCVLKFVVYGSLWQVLLNRQNCLSNGSTRVNPVLSVRFVFTRCLVFCVLHYRSCLSFFSGPLYCLFFLDLRLRFTTVVSSNFPRLSQLPNYYLSA